MRVFTERGVHGLTHRAVDAAAGLAQGSTSNLFRTRRALVTVVAEEVARLRLQDGPEPGSPLSIAWLELLLIGRRDDAIAAAIEPTRTRMRALLDEARPSGQPLTTPELAALLTGLEFAQTVTGVHLDAVALLEGLAASG